jgi:uncharacterized protein YbbC (DUF1343 family)
MPMRHGLTLGEMGHWFVRHFNLDVDYRVIAMDGWAPEGPGFGWPDSRIWINPSPNAANLNMARAYAGTVMLEGTTLSEGRGTTRPLEGFGAPWIDPWRLLAEMETLAPHWLEGCRLRPFFFEPTFHKHAGERCGGIMIHVEDPAHYDPRRFRPWRLVALALKALRRIEPDRPLWHANPYEYEYERLAIDLIDGGPRLRQWVEDEAATPADLDAMIVPEERAWAQMRAPFLR